MPQSVTMWGGLTFTIMSKRPW